MLDQAGSIGRGRVDSKRERVAFVLVGLLLLIGIALPANALREGMAVRDVDDGATRLRSAYPSALTRATPWGTSLFSRAARGTWDVDGPADRIEFGGRRWYLSEAPVDDLGGYTEVPDPVWPDVKWYGHGTLAVAQTRDGRLWLYSLSGGP